MVLKFLCCPPRYLQNLTSIPQPMLVHCLQLFETGVDEMSWDDLSHARDDWPAVRNVTEYRRKAYQVRDLVLCTMCCL